MARHRVDVDIESAAPALATLAGFLRTGVDPLSVDWREIGDVQADLFDRPDDATPGREAEPSSEPMPEPAAADWPSRLPAGFIDLARQVSMHRDPDRFIRLHQMGQRLVADRRRWADALDPDLLQLQQWARDVRREIHKMHAFVRFRPLDDTTGTRHVAWFEPEHAVVRAAAPFFVKRFAAMSWSILTPRLSLDWDRRRLRFGPGADRDRAPAADAGEALWITYYRSIFNPARLNPAAMLREMPRRYWSNLPEAAAIPDLIRHAPERSARMQAHASTTLRRLPTRAAATPAVPPSTPEARLNALARQARHCSDCPMAAHATQTVWGEGGIGATVMLVGEQPGDQEDLANRPFVGPAGQLLQQALTRLGWPRSRLYLTNAVKHFRFELRGKRRIHKTPGQQEVLACAQWLEAEIGLVRPQVIVALGSTAATSLLGQPVSVRDSVGRVWQRPDGIAVHVVHHPAAILRRAESGAPSFDEWVAALGLAWPTPMIDDRPEAAAAVAPAAGPAMSTRARRR